MNPTDIMLHERSQTQESSYCVILFYIRLDQTMVIISSEGRLLIDHDPMVHCDTAFQEH